MLRKGAFFARVHRVGASPGPTTKLDAAVVSKGLLHFGLRVHHKRAVLCRRLANRLALQHQHFAHL
jgi:hypothetical protein